MSQIKTKNSPEDLMASLMEQLNLSGGKGHVNSGNNTSDFDGVDVLTTIQNNQQDETDMSTMLNATFVGGAADDKSLVLDETELLNFSPEENQEFERDLNQAVKLVPLSEPVKADIKVESKEAVINIPPSVPSAVDKPADKTVAAAMPSDKTVALAPVAHEYSNVGDSEKTVAIAGYANRNDHVVDNNVKVSIGQSRAASSSGYAAWGNSNSNVAQADNLRIAQEKILELEKENEKLRIYNEELTAAAEIVRERADLLTAQVHEFRNDRDALEQSFKNEMQLMRNQLLRKESDLQKAQTKIDELDSRLKFDMKKIRIRERELENRLELIRAEKNALVKSKDEQILDLRRKMDQVQLEVESYRQKCVDLNKVLDTNQDSFKRTTRALRLAMANLELQDENKVPLKKAD